MSTRTEYPNFLGNQGKFLKVNHTETGVVWDEVNASDITGVLGIDHGGTGADNANDALNNLLPDQSGHAGEALFTDGTDPYWSAAGVGSGVDTRVYSTGASSVGFNPALGFRYAGLAGIIGSTVESAIQETFGENVIVKRIIVQLSTGTINDTVTLTLRKNGVDTSTTMIIPANAATEVISFDVSESYSSTDLYSIKIESIGTGSLVFQNFETVVQVSGGTPLGVQSVTGLNTNNTDPFNPIVQVSVDGVSITGLGTPGSPLVATPSTSIDTRNYGISLGTISTGARTVFLGLHANSAVSEALILDDFGDNVVVKRLNVTVSANWCNEDATVVIRKNGVDTAHILTVPAGVTGTFELTINESYTSTDTFSMYGSISDTATGGLTFGSVSDLLVQVSGGSPLGVQSVTGDIVDNTDPFNPVINDSVKEIKVNITSAEILDLNTTPKQIIAAPGAGKTIDVINAFVRVNYNSSAYETNTNLQLYNTPGSVILSNNSSLTDTSSTIRRMVYSSVASLMNENTSVSLTVGNGNPTAGNSTIDVYVVYKIIDL